MTHTDLLDFLVEHPPRPAIGRAISEGRPIEFLGGFGHIPPGNRPGWCVRITSRTGKKFYVGIITPQDISHELVVRCLDKIPWRHWDGDKGQGILYRGDRPEIYERIKRWVINQKIKI
jgi:hypothetical protein